MAPPGIRTGTAALSATAAVQKSTPSHPPMFGASGIVTRTTPAITSAVSVTAVMSALSFAGNG
jgi:hypothetical protein